ncbi:MAG: sugar ABC transporter substrate-binding protein [Acidobacteria bacterium]|nr:MAG: sugar ABC transporter substrate-binding protein [Acidobacteriota bacterium]
MKIHRLRWFVFALGLSITIAGCNKNNPAEKSLTIAVIPQGSTHEYWKSIHAGAMKAVQDLSQTGTHVNIIWKGPLREDDREQQTQVVEGFISQGVQGIVLAPFDSHALVRPVEEAAQAGIPTVVVDSGLESQKVVSFISTDNKKGGALAADRMGELLHGKGKVLLLRYQEGSASTEAREQGFVEQIKKGYPGIELISSNQYAGPTRDTAKRASENLLTRYAEQVQGIFTPNESSTAGMLLALQDIQKAGKVVFVGFDSSETFIEAMRNKQLQGIVVQDPFRMGELGVKTIVDHLQGKSVDKRVDTGATMVTPENMDTPEAQRVLRPPLAKYLGGL